MPFLQIYSSLWNDAGLQWCHLIGYPLIVALNMGALLFSPFEPVLWRDRGHGFHFGRVVGGLLGSSLHSTEMVRRSGVTDRIAL